MTTMIEFDNVSIVFGDKPQVALPLMDQNLTRDEIKTKTGQILGVHNCNLKVAVGEISVLMGLSGSGKSTLLRAVNGLNKVTRGRMMVSDGSNMIDAAAVNEATMRDIRTKRVSMVFQSFGLLPWTPSPTMWPSAWKFPAKTLPRAVPGPCRNWSVSTSRNGPTGWCPNFRAACASASASPGPSPPTHQSC